MKSAYRNNKGITLISLVVMIIIIIIIATTSLIAGNKLIVQSKDSVDAQVIESVVEAIERRKIEVKSSGTITPLGVTYVGTYSPAIGNGEINAVGWYMLDKDDLLELGVSDTSSEFLVNYDYEKAFSLQDKEYVEKYFVVTFINEILKNDVATYGTALSTNHGYVDKSQSGKSDAYGKGWYYVSANELIKGINKLSDYKDVVIDENYISNSYLLNPTTNSFVKVTNDFSEYTK